MEKNNSEGYRSPAVMPDTSPMSVGSYILMIILTAIPIVGIIMLFVWSFSGSTNLNKKNFARAQLLLMLISTALCIILSVAGIFTFASFLSHIGRA